METPSDFPPSALKWAKYLKIAPVLLCFLLVVFLEKNLLAASAKRR